MLFFLGFNKFQEKKKRKQIRKLFQGTSVQKGSVYKKCSNFHPTRIAIDQQNQGKTYNQLLKDSEAFNNPSAVDNLYSELGLEKNSYYSFMSKSKFPQDEFAKDLRQQQVSKLAFR